VWLPPSDQREEAWLDLYGVFQEIADEGPGRHQSQVVALRLLERVVDATEFGPQAVADAVVPWVEHVREMAFKRAEAGKVDMEVSYYELAPIDKGFYGYILAMLFAVVVWLRPRWRIPYVATWVLTGLATASLVVGIVYRSVLLGRPPVLNLYDTILFITATAAIVGMVAEAINRGRIALTVGAVLGVAGLFIAGRYEISDGTDTLRQLQAVLDTNFWLSTHVTTVTFGYSAGLLAGALAHVYILGQLFGWRRSNPGFYREVAKMVYGVLCFGVLLSTVGTILGGIWANYSWGRFWGWDPKENGALMIVLWELFILHARLAGFIRNWGMCLLAVAGNIWVAFSWWHVNNMGVGLHSYGFTSGIVRTLWIFYGIELLVIALGVVTWWVQRQVAKRTEELRRDAGEGELRQRTS
jgi:ABC-type transport system involved in cytochrome c biogenesis permease subunit